MDKYLLDKAIELTGHELNFNALTAIGNDRVSMQAADHDEVMSMVKKFYGDLEKFKNDAGK